MDQRPPVAAVASDFRGQVSNIDPGDCPEGAMLEQVNMMSIVPGQLTTRGGLKRIEVDVLE